MITLSLERKKSHKTAMVTGVTGQDGSYLVELLLEKGYSVVGVKRRSSTENYDRISHLLEDSRFVIAVADISDPHSIAQLIKKYKPEEFYNLAAQSHVGTSFSQPSYTFNVNTLGVINCLEAIREHSPATKFYQASTSEMFGKNFFFEHDGKIGTIDSDLTYEQAKSLYGDIKPYQDESTPFSPRSPYGVAKLASHYAVRMYREAYGIHASCGILFNHESPRRGENFVTRKITKWIADFYAWMNDLNIVDYEDSYVSTEGDFIHLRCYFDNKVYKFPKLRLGNLDAKRDWGFAGDYVEAMHAMLQLDSPDDFVICTGECHSVRDFLEAALSYVGVKDLDEVVVIDPKFYRPAEVDYLRGSCNKANQLLNWKNKTSFEELVEMMVINDIQKKTPQILQKEIVDKKLG